MRGRHPFSKARQQHPQTVIQPRVCDFSMMEQVRLCAIWPTENWLGSSLNRIHCLRVLLSCCRKRMSDERGRSGKRRARCNLKCGHHSISLLSFIVRRKKRDVVVVVVKKELISISSERRVHFTIGCLLSRGLCLREPICPLDQVDSTVDIE